MYKKEIEFKEPVHPNLKKAFERGIPVKVAQFMAAVNNADGIPETYFSTDSNAESRRVRMWWIQGDGLLCWHQGQWFMTPSANVKFHKFE